MVARNIGFRFYRELKYYTHMTINAVYYRNDERAEVKRQLNEKLGSQLVEEKSYADYP